jgi:hypothetical protein
MLSFFVRPLDRRMEIMDIGFSVSTASAAPSSKSYL